MTELLNDLISDITNIIEAYLIKSDDLQEKWVDNEKIKLDKELWKPILTGDWSKYTSKINYQNNNHEDFDLLLNEKISKSELVEKIVNEINTKNEKVNPYYNFNINPNLFFLLFEEICEELDIELIPCFCNKTKKIIAIDFKKTDSLRDETKKLIMFHFRIWNMFLNYNDLLDDEFITNFLVRNTIIQQKFSSDESIRYVDICYNLGDYSICVEVDEHHHKIKKDMNRLYGIEIRNKTIILNIRLLDLYDDINCIKMTKLFKEFINYFCKFYYKSSKKIEDKTNAVILYLSEIKEFDYLLSNCILKIKNNIVEVKLGEINTIEGIGNIDCSIEEIIDNYYSSYKPETDFKNCHKKLSKENLYKKRNRLILTKKGLKRILMCISIENWKEKNDFIDYQDDIEDNYIKLIEEIFEDKDDKKNILLENFLNLDILKNKKASKKKYFKMLAKLNYEDEGTDIYHEDIPFLVKSKGSYIDFNFIDRLFDLSDINNYEVYKNHLLSDNSRFLYGYRVITYKEYETFIKYKKLKF